MHTLVIAFTSFFHVYVYIVYVKTVMEKNHCYGMHASCKVNSIALTTSVVKGFHP